MGLRLRITPAEHSFNTVDLLKGKKLRRFIKQCAKEFRRDIDKEIKEKIKRGELDGVVLRKKGESRNKFMRRTGGQNKS